MEQSERRFREIMESSGKEVKYPTVTQDRKGHWDIMVNGMKIEVKGQKKVNRWDNFFTKDIHVELINVHGEPGWIKGEADFVAFEQEDCYLLVPRLPLLQLTEANLKEDAGKGFYMRHTRDDRQDLITLVPLEDVLKLEHYYIKK